jgi:hypothetical protein
VLGMMIAENAGIREKALDLERSGHETRFGRSGSRRKSNIRPRFTSGCALVATPQQISLGRFSQT